MVTGKEKGVSKLVTGKEYGVPKVITEIKRGAQIWYLAATISNSEVVSAKVTKLSKTSMVD